MIAQINAPHFRIVAQLLRAALAKYLAIFQDVRTVRNVQVPHVMIGDQNANTGGLTPE